MATKKIVPRANGEGAIGDNTAGAEKYWGGGFFNNINGTNAIEMAAFNNSLQWKENTTYASGDIFFTSELKAGQYLECTTDGTSGSAKPTIPASVVPNTTTITDNTVIWTVREISSTQIDDSYSRQPSTAYQSGDIRFLYGVLPVGWFLECSTAGTSGSGDLTIATPTEGDTVTDGTVEWTIKKMGTGGGGDGVPLGAILPLAHNSTIPAGYLLCDGSAVSRTMYPDLYDAIGITYGAGDGSTTFNLPDYNTAERFCQGSTVAGVVKQAGLPNITGGATAYEFTGTSNPVTSPDRFSDNGKSVYFDNLTNAGIPTSGKTLTTNKDTTAGNSAALCIDASRSSAIYGASNTVQPNALTCRYIIKAFDGQTAASALIDVTQYAADLATKATKTAVVEYTTPDYANGIEWSYTTANTEQTYTAPSDGFLSYFLMTRAQQYSCYVKINGDFAIAMCGSSDSIGSGIAGDPAMGIIKVSKDDIITVKSYYTSSSLTKLVFFPPVGSISN